MEEDEDIVLISSTDFNRLGYIKRILADNNIPYVYNNGFCTRHNSYLVNKEIIVNRQDYIKAKKIIEENDEFFSENAQIIELPDELKDIDENYFEEQEYKHKKYKQIENAISKIIIYGLLIFTEIVLILIVLGII